MAKDLLDGSATRRIGGPGHIIEIDMSKFGKLKYNRGRRVFGKWVLGGYCRTTGECFLVECDNNKRNQHTLLRLIKAHVEPGTIIVTVLSVCYPCVKYQFAVCSLSVRYPCLMCPCVNCVFSDHCVLSVCYPCLKCALPVP